MEFNMLIGNPNRLANYIIIPFNLQEIGFYQLPTLGDPKIISDCELIGVVQLHREEFYLVHGKELSHELNKIIIENFYPTYPGGTKPMRLTTNQLINFPDLKGRFVSL
jgi:hypothetical protein